MINDNCLHDFLNARHKKYETKTVKFLDQISVVLYISTIYYFRLVRQQLAQLLWLMLSIIAVGVLGQLETCQSPPYAKTVPTM